MKRLPAAAVLAARRRRPVAGSRRPVSHCATCGAMIESAPVTRRGRVYCSLVCSLAA